MISALRSDVHVADSFAANTLLNFDQYSAALQSFDEAFLEDLLWFANDVARVEQEIQTAYVQAVDRWRTIVAFLANRCL